MAKDNKDEGGKGTITVKVCTCKSTYQDEKYGKGKRLMNFMKKTGGHRCTVCGKAY